LRIPEQTIQDIREATDIVEVISDYVSLKKRGANYWALSPFTQEKTASFSVSPQKGIFKCFSTGKGGDAITFIMEIDGVGYVEALKILAKKYNIPLELEESPSEEYIQKQNEKESILIVLEFASKHFQENLLQSEEGKSLGLSYFKERRFNQKTIETFALGYALKDWTGFTKIALKKGYTLENLEKAGLTIIKNEEEGKYYDRFRERVTFPIHNLSGKVIAFGARLLSKEAKQAKYLNSPETLVYHKSHILYGISQARQFIRQEENCYLVEGYTDVLSLHQEGIKNVVASSGTALTENQVRLLKRFTQKITLLYDGDKAGVKAALRGVDLALEAGLEVRAVLLPEGEDPDSYAQKLGGATMEDFLKKEAKDLISFKIALYAEESKDPLKKSEAVREIITSLVKIPDAIQKSFFMKQVSEQMKVEEQVLWTEHNKLLAKDLQKKSTPPKTQENLPLPEGVSSPEKEVTKAIEISEDKKDLIVYSPLQLSERENVRLLLQYASSEIAEDLNLCEYLLQEIEDLHFEHEIYQQILELYRENLSQGVILDFDFFLKHENEDFKKLTANLVSERYEISENWEKRFGVYVPKEKDILDNLAFKAILRVKQRHIRKKYKGLARELAQANDFKAQEPILSKMQELKEIEKEIAKLLGNVITKF